MEITKKAIQKLNEIDLNNIDLNNLDSYLETQIMTCFNIIGYDLFQGETVYLNNKQDIMELIDEFNLSKEEIIDFLVLNELYNTKDKYIIFDGHNLECFKNLSYCIKEIKKNMNYEIAQILLDLD